MVVCVIAFCGTHLNLSSFEADMTLILKRTQGLPQARRACLAVQGRVTDGSSFWTQGRLFCDSPIMGHKITQFGLNPISRAQGSYSRRSAH